ncbi:hypothetical protein D3C81_1745960 [compost metagenome]
MVFSGIETTRLSPVPMVICPELLTSLLMPSTIRYEKPIPSNPPIKPSKAASMMNIVRICLMLEPSTFIIPICRRRWCVDIVIATMMEMEAIIRINPPTPKATILNMANWDLSCSS